MNRLQAFNKIDWAELDRTITKADFDALGPKYAGVAPKLKRKIGCVLRRRTPKPVSWKLINSLIAGTYNTTRLWATSTGFADLHLKADYTLQEGVRFTSARNKALEIALICHMNNCNTAGFLIEYHLFESQALYLDSRLRLEAQQRNMEYPTSRFVCSREFWRDFKARNSFRRRRVNGEAASVDMTREEVISFLNDQIQPANSDPNEQLYDIQRVPPNRLINMDESALFWMDLGSSTIAPQGATLSGYKKSKNRTTIAATI